MILDTGVSDLYILVCPCKQYEWMFKKFGKIFIDIKNNVETITTDASIEVVRSISWDWIKACFVYVPHVQQA